MCPFFFRVVENHVISTHCWLLSVNNEVVLYKVQKEIAVLVYLTIFQDFSDCLYFSSFISVTVMSTLTKSNNSILGKG